MHEGINFTPISTGGRLLTGRTSFGNFRIEWDEYGNLIEEHIDMLQPKPHSQIKPIIAEALRSEIAHKLAICRTCPCKKSYDSCTKRVKCTSAHCALCGGVSLRTHRCPEDRWVAN